VRAPNKASVMTLAKASGRRPADAGGPPASDHELAPMPARPGRELTQMDESNPLTHVSRRTMVQGAAAVAAAGTATLVLAGTAQAATAHPAHSEPQADLAAAGTGTAIGSEGASGDGLVVHVRDVRTGDLDVYSGESHTAVRDPKLAKLLAALAR
jgi:hypothetical protein